MLKQIAKRMFYVVMLLILVGVVRPAANPSAEARQSTTDIRASYSWEAPSLFQGYPIKYLFSINNPTTVTASDIVVDISLPEDVLIGGYHYLGFNEPLYLLSASSCTIDAARHDMECHIDFLTGNGRAELQVIAIPDGTDVTSVTSTISVTTATPDSDLTNNVYTNTNTLVASPPDYPPHVELITNGEFSNGLADWQVSPGLQASVSDGVLNMGGEIGYASPNLSQPLPELPSYGSTRIKLMGEVWLGNTGNTPKNLIVQLTPTPGLTLDFDTCYFTVPPNTPLQPYRLNFFPYAGPGFRFEINDITNDGQSGLLVDKVTLRHEPFMFHYVYLSDNDNHNTCTRPSDRTFWVSTYAVPNALSEWNPEPTSGMVYLTNPDHFVLFDTSDPYVTSGWLNIAANTWTDFLVQMNANSTSGCTTARLYFLRQGDTAFDLSRSVTATLIPGVMKTASFPVASNPLWTGTIRRLRLDPLDCGQAGTGSVSFGDLSFATMTGTPPVLLNPPDTSTLTDATLSWEPVEGATSYRMWIDTDPLFTYPYTELVSVGNVTSYRPPSLQVATMYYWQVQASNSESFRNDWSDIRSFMLAPGDAPGLLSPADNSTLNTVTLSWAAVNGASSYEVMLTTDPDAPDPQIVTVEATTYTPPFPLLSTTYYWQVRAVMSQTSALTAWSALRSFTVTSGLSSAPAPWLYTDEDITLSWGRVSWATAYEFQLSTHASFTPLTDSAVLPAVTTSRQLILTNGRYYWRVRAQQANGAWGAWSSVASFTVDAP